MVNDRNTGFVVLALVFALSVTNRVNAIPPPLRISAGTFLAGNKVFHFHGLNWFGFNVKGGTMVDGLWVGGSSFATDFSTILFKIRLLGFNAIRIPFIFDNLDLSPANLSRPCTINPLQMIIEQTKYKNVIPPAYIGPFPKQNTCNWYLPSSSTMDRFLWVVTQIIKNDMYVVLDYQPMGLEDYAYHPDIFISKWKGLWKKITKLPRFHQDISDRILIDFMNEPDSMLMWWDKSPPRYHTNMTLLYLRTMDALDDMGTPLFLIEGTGQNAYGGMCWGNGFITDPTLIRAYSLSDPNPFFRALLGKPYLDRVIVSPHVYGPTISAAKKYDEAYVWNRMTVSFGYLGTKGYCNKGKCHKFPILIGEFGSFFTDPRDLTFYRAFASWMRYTFHSNINWMFWAYNENSGDTGGIVMNNWQDINWMKIEWLRRHMNLGL